MASKGGWLVEGIWSPGADTRMPIQPRVLEAAIVLDAAQLRLESSWSPHRLGDGVVGLWYPRVGITVDAVRPCDL